MSPWHQEQCIPPLFMHFLARTAVSTDARTRNPEPQDALLNYTITLTTRRSEFMTCCCSKESRLCASVLPCWRSWSRGPLPRVQEATRLEARFSFANARPA